MRNETGVAILLQNKKGIGVKKSMQVHMKEMNTEERRVTS